MRLFRHVLLTAALTMIGLGWQQPMRVCMYVRVFV